MKAVPPMNSGALFWYSRPMEHAPRVAVYANHELLSRAAADRVAAIITQKPNAVLCLPTGNTPTRTYELLAERFRRGEFITSDLTVVKLDEWGGLTVDDPSTCEAYLQKNVIVPLEIQSERYISFRSDSPDPEKEAARIQGLITLRTFDLTLLGLGLNGHVGLNEPHQESGPVHVAHLDATTLQHSMLRGTRGVHYGLTIGFDDILRSENIVMLVSGANKREQLRAMLTEKISPAHPATRLRESANLQIMADSAAAPGGEFSKLSH